MGKRGPAPTPTEVLRLRGSWRGNRNMNQPQPTPGRPRCPAWLDPEAKRKWKALIPELEGMGLLTAIDGDALAAYCVAWSELKHACDTLAREGRTFKTESGYLTPHPAVAQQRSAWKAVREFAALFGLDPSSRSRLAVSEPSPEPDEFEKLLSGSVSGFARRRDHHAGVDGNQRPTES